MVEVQPRSLEEFVSHLHRLAFFRELTFSKNTFSPEPGRSLELADGVVWLDEHLIVFQMKERFVSVEKDTDKWFKNKVLKKGIRQIKDSLDYLGRYKTISVTNEQGHTFSIDRKAIKKITKAILFLPHFDDTTFFRKFYVSKTADFVHLIDGRDYLEICKTLRVPADIMDYFEYREAVLTEVGDVSAVLREEMIVGQFISSNHNVEPTASSISYLHSLKQDAENWDISGIIENLHKNIEYSASPVDYYRILFELAKLPRSAWREVKTRFDLTYSHVQKGKFTLPYRFTYPHTGCGFIFVPTPPELSAQPDFQLFRGNGIRNFTLAHKYDQKLDRCVGVVIAKQGHDYLIDWCFTEFPWCEDPEMDAKMKDAPLRPIKETEQRRYRFEE